jgi:outer membrane autotransporter protein
MPMFGRLSSVGALLALASAAPAFAQTEQVATVDGRILASDGSRILYIPTGRPGDLRIRLPDGREQIVVSGSAYGTNYGYLTPTGAIFAAAHPVDFVTKLFVYNGSTVQDIATLNAGNSLVARGNFAVFSGDTAGQARAVPNFVHRLDTGTGQIIRIPGNNGNTELDVTTGGIVAYWTSDGYSGPNDPTVDYNIMAFDGSSQRRITNSSGPIFNFAPVTDGTSFIFTREQVCCSTPYSDLILSDGTTETLLRSAPGNVRARYLGDYQINAGWIAFRETNGTLILRSPAGVSTAVGPSHEILAISEFGEVAYRLGGTTFLRLANGQAIDVGAYPEAFNLGRDWYFYSGGRLVRYVDGRLVALDAVFAAQPGPFTAVAGATLYGVSDIAIARPITLSGQTILDTRQYDILLSGTLSGAGSLDVRGGGTLILRGTNSYSGGTSIVDATLVGDTNSLRGAIANSALLIFDQDVNGVFQGTITGNGNVQKTGSGTVTLVGAQPYSGVTILDGGGIAFQAIDTPSAFRVNSGLLSGTGHIGGLTATGGIIRPGAPGATITSAGAIALGAGSTFVVDLAGSGSSSRLAAAGSATLGGSHLVLAYAPGSYRPGDAWTILTAASVSGQFGSVDVAPMRLLSPSLVYGANSVVVRLMLDQAAFTALAATANQAAAAGAAAQLPATSPLLRGLVTLPDEAIRRQFSSLSGDIHASTTTVLAEATSFTRGALRDQLISGTGSLWASASAQRQTFQSSDEAAGLTGDGQDYAIGAQAPLSSSAVAGVAAWYGEHQASGGTGRLDYSQVGAGAYGRLEVGPAALRAMAGRTWYDLATTRQISFVGDVPFNERLTGQSSATSTEASAEVAFPVRRGQLTVAPFAGLRYQRLELDGLTETGGEAALNAGRHDSSHTLSRLGVDGMVDVPIASIRISAAWEHELSSLNDRRDAEWPSANSADFRVIGLHRPRDLLDASLSAEFKVGVWHLSAGAQYQGGGGYEAASARLGARIDF